MYLLKRTYYLYTLYFTDEKLDETEDVVRAVVEEITPGELVCVGNQSGTSTSQINNLSHYHYKF